MMVVVPPVETFETVVTSPLTTDTAEPVGVTDTLVTADVAEQPAKLVAVTQYCPDAETPMDCVVALSTRYTSSPHSR